jgi:para-aminobenzoate synthetase/4-amino-4-deoxychorismate lyase
VPSDRRADPPMTTPLPRGAGVALFAGHGAWLPRRASDAASPSPAAAADDALLLSDPVRTLRADKQDDIRALLDEVEREQTAGRYVAGYLAYEAGAAFGLTVRGAAPDASRPRAAARDGAAPNNAARPAASPTTDALPLAWMAVYQPERASVIPAAEWRHLLAETDVSAVATALAGVKPELSVSRDEYTRAIGRVREYIAAGDTYQVNYTVRGRFALGSPDAPLDALDYFLALVIRQPVPYAAYLDLGDAQIVSLSPELFLRRDGNRLESRPMKGTSPRGATHTEDVALAYELAETEKERAENLMIVDMVRNDLGRVCRAGSVRVPTLFAVEPYRTVWQMVSTVTGDVNPRATLTDIMQAVFPGSSITGAPKHHTMEIIAQLETEPRGVYTGALGLFSPGGDFTTNIAIRTITHKDGACRLGTGSGVVWDSGAASEYDETLVKASFATPPAAGAPPRGGPWRPQPAALLRAAVAGLEDFYLFETVLLEAATDRVPAPEDRDAGPGLSPLHLLSDEAVASRYRFLQEHLDRMGASAAALGLPFEHQAARGVMIGLARVHPEALVARIQLDAAGRFSLSTREAPAPPAGAVSLLVSPFRVDPDDPFLRHKTSVRGFYNREHRRAVSRDCFDALFLNRLDRVSEGAITNLFARFGDRWVTPPLDDGLLPGVWRAAFLKDTGAGETSLTLADLRTADELVVGNSVRGSVQVARLAVEPLVS